MSRARPGAVLLDAMGTLVRLEAPAPRLRELLASRHGVLVSEAQAAAAMRAEIAVYRREHLGAGTPATLAALRLRCAGVLRDALPADPALPAAEDLVGTLLDSLRFAAYDEVGGVLAALRARGHPLAVVSNWDVSLEEVLVATGLRAHVDGVVASAALGTAKPDPRPFAHALEALGAEAATALHAGDTVAEDVAGARAAGVRAVLVDRDGAAGACDPQGAEVVEDLTGLLALAA